MKTNKNISEVTFLNFVSQSVLSWTEYEKEIVKTAFDDIKEGLTALSLSLPNTIYFVKVTGDEEGHAAYTRGTAIIFPKATLSAQNSIIQKTICHELFHILTRSNPELREQLYSIIGFRQCHELEYPPELFSRKITNPDAPKNDHWIELKIHDKIYKAIPILFSVSEQYDLSRGGEFFEYLQCEFLQVKQGDDSFQMKPVYVNRTLNYIDMSTATSFFEQVGLNTSYIIHPEEILADNFAFLVLNTLNLPSPDIIKKQFPETNHH